MRTETDSAKRDKIAAEINDELRKAREEARAAYEQAAERISRIRDLANEFAELRHLTGLPALYRGGHVVAYRELVAHWSDVERDVSALMGPEILRGRVYRDDLREVA